MHVDDELICCSSEELIEIHTLFLPYARVRVTVRLHAYIIATIVHLYLKGDICRLTLTESKTKLCFVNN